LGRIKLNLTKLLNLIEVIPEYKRLLEELTKQDGTTSAVVLEAAKPYLIAALYKSLKRPMLVVTAQPENCQKLYEQIAAWSNPGGVKLFPEPDALPYERIAADASTELDRVQVLSVLAGINGDESPPLVVVSAPSLMSRLTPHREFAAACHTIKLGMEVEPLELLKRWQDIGYEVENTVEIPGRASRRGGIVDIYPPTSQLPARIEFLGNTIESIRTFDPVTQRSLNSIGSIAVCPAAELSASRTDSLLNFLPEDSLLVLDEPPNIEQAIDDLEMQAEKLRADKIERGELEAGLPRPYFNWKELAPKIKDKPRLTLTAWGIDQDEATHQLNFTAAPGYAGQLPSLVKKAKQLLKQKQRLLIVSHQASRLAEILEQEDIIASPVTEIEEIPPPGSLTLVQGLLGEGWIMNGQTILLTDAEVFGFIKQRRLIKRRPVPHHQFLVELIPGDYVVHVEHGVAKFAGVVRMGSNNSEEEYLLLKYAAGDKLYVPTDQIDRVNRYIGGGDQPPTLSRLGTQEWSRTKQRVKESVEEVAQELLSLYAAREVLPGFSFSKDTVWQQELEASFPYVETPDQIEVQGEVKADMEKAKPMDRLVCGDVGYGKTEVAVRAAFKAVMDGRQVAVLVPTTVLAQQHYATFRERLEAFPVRVEVLSRFKTHREQQAIIEGLANGSVDICIGTHRLLQKDIKFKNLGLLIIDEEQRFGVAHKEHLKKMRREVDVLTLSATPIPRTLHMSLVGVRDMSTMETPPEQRLPIKTYVARYDERLIREAVLREMERNGQVFFVHNRVESIDQVAEKLQSLIPEARISVAHGQMPEGELERVMADFSQGKSDILVTTTIIESGLDMPNVNTLIVNRADRFGLTQLYQLRGRVGRGANLAYAYFLYDKGRMLTPTAEKRLKTIFEATELGAGFSIALKDLEIRGAGTLLGPRQSGHISAVGFSLYTRLLAEAVESQKAKQAGIPEEKRPSPLPQPTLALPLRAYIPEEYVSDIETRLGLYQRLTRLDKLEQTGAMADEFDDRFGALPAEVQNLLYAVRIKILAVKAGIESISIDDGLIVLRLFEGMQFSPQQRQLPLPDGVRMGVRQISLSYKRIGEWKGKLESVLKEVVI
jgi:transcription-repair coupling factor (superfamily II helicase)